MTTTDARPVTVPDAAPERPRRVRGKSAAAEVGREPHVDLLPAEVHVDRRARGIARRAWLGVVLAAAVVVLGAGGAVAHEMATAADLRSAQAETSTLLAQQQRFAEVRAAEQQTQLLRAGQAVGGATEINWGDTLTSLQTALPTDVEISAMTIAAADATTPFSQSTAALAQSRVATLSITVKSPEIPAVPDWNERLSSLTGYLDSSISSISYEKEKARYSSVIELQLGEKAFDGKYTKDADR
ncbi:hypothetical protein [Curtobacterium sp. Leaf183]|uniref:hypothetical protein n=1 Tax=Curtobacterium sp. Leaf183 TaxID=1736291 RepID=UPI000B0326C5|nr:hypothetical protein [Curtobacterium sp. Leaf183]